VLKNPDLQSRLAAGETLRIMPLGDSITEGFCDRASNCEWPAEIKFPSDGYGVEGCYTNTTIVNPGSKGYREFLGNRLLESGIDFTYVGSVDVVAGLAHEGHSGFTISDLDYCIQNAGWLEQAKPDIILLHIGTNDAGLIQQPTVMLTSLRALLTQIYQESPATTEVILALVIPAREGTRVDLDPSMPMANEILAEYNAGIPAVVDEFRAMGKHVSLVDMWNTVQSPQEYDQMGLHPNPVAAERMAQVWFEKIIEILEGQ
jgi:lysophospholipase L1-like esterase